ncbi:TatD family hydrolase [Chloroflexota bacterium]
MLLSDSHCHLAGQQPEQLAEALDQAKTKGVVLMVAMGMDLESSAENVDLAQDHQEVLAAVGIHPWNAISPTGEVRRRFEELVKQKKVAVIGEIGLDYARCPETKEIQKDLLAYELSLARETGLPVSLHCREAHQDMMDIIHKEGVSGLTGSIHGFTGDRAALNDWLALGIYVSIGRRGFLIDEVPSLSALISEIPSDCLITETDAAAQPGDLSDVVLVVEKLASLRATNSEEIANSATANLSRLLML